MCGLPWCAAAAALKAIDECLLEEPSLRARVKALEKERAALAAAVRAADAISDEARAGSNSEVFLSLLMLSLLPLKKSTEIPVLVLWRR